MLVYVAFALAIAASGGLYVRRSDRVLQAQIERELSSIAQFKVAQLVAWRDKETNDWAGFAAQPLVSAGFRRALAERDHGHVRDVAEALESKRQRTGAEAALLLDAGGGVVAASVGARPPDSGDLALVGAALARAAPVVDDGEHVGDPFTVAVRIRAASGARGVLLVRYDLGRSLHELVRHWPHRAATAEPVLVRRDGDFVAAITAPVHSDRRRKPLSAETPTARAVRGVEHGVVSGIDYRGVPVIAAVLPVPGSPWVLSAKVDRAEVFAAGREHAVAFAAGTLLLLTIGGVAVWFWWRAQVGRSREEAHEREEQALRERFDALWSSANDVVFLLDADRRIVDGNGRALAAYGYTREEFRRLRVDDLRAAPARAEVDAQWARLLADGATRFEAPQQRKDGSSFPAEVSWAIALGGEAPVVLSVVRDLSEREAAAAERDRARQERERLQAELVFADRLASVGTLAAGVAHEINNPLSYLLANLEYVQDGALARAAAAGEDGGEELAALSEALDGGRRIAEIVRSLRTFSRRDRDDGDGIASVTTAVRAAARMAEGQARSRARLVVELADTPPVAGREHELAQVVLNLLLNAIQAIPDGRPEENEVRVATSCNDRRVVLRVSDTGSGIAAEHLDHIFDPFFTTKRVGEGTGLGLSICHGIIERMGGTIQVETALGRGTTFTVRLPRQAPTAAGRAA